MRRLVATMLVVLGAGALASAASAKVLLVGTYHGIKGQYTSIEAAVKAAKRGDWILVAPGDYKTTKSVTPNGANGDFPAGVLISKPDVTLRGMNRNSVIVDGTRKGPKCTDNAKDQNFGPSAKGGRAGLNGIEIWKADNVKVENLTACNFLGGSGGDGGTGNEVWWNGGANSGKIDGWGYLGEYLNATSTWFNPNTSLSGVTREVSAAEYGIFSSNWSGGTWNNTYASNMNDSGYYIGACQQQCNQTVNNAWAEYNALGYSGSNSGGTLVVKHSQFDNNEDGFSTNSQNGDNPPPQDGACPNNGTSPITHTHSCWVFMDNYVHDNNDPNVPAAGSAAQGPVGTGMSLAGSEFDTVMHNRFVNNDAWGVVVIPYTDNGTSCPGGTLNSPLTGNGTCLWDDYGDALLDNSFSHEGSYGNPTNGDFGQLNSRTSIRTDCFAGNTDASGVLSSYAAQLQQKYPNCTGADVNANLNISFLDEVLCDTQVSLLLFGCQPGDHYPRMTAINNGLHKLPSASKLQTMPNPCKGVPKNAWCRKPKKH